MTNLNELLNWFEDKDKVLVSLSGGVDSALVAYAANKKLGKNAIAVTADYKTLSSEELDSAKSIAREIGITHRIIEYSELENENFVKNDNKRCFYCRDELSSELIKLSNSLGLPSGCASSMSDAKAPDAQMGMEKALTALACGLAGGNMIYESSGMMASLLGCLLYTSDAADDTPCV